MIKPLYERREAMLKQLNKEKQAFYYTGEELPQGIYYARSVADDFVLLENNRIEVPGKGLLVEVKWVPKSDVQALKEKW